MMTVIEAIPEKQKALNTDKKIFIYCKKCGLYLTRQEYAIEVEHYHEHLQCNPNGFTFVFKCFSKAPGCLLLGKPTEENTWFKGYSWRLSLCQNCGEHLGWYFKKQDIDIFFGLISDKLEYKNKSV